MRTSLRWVGMAIAVLLMLTGVAAAYVWWASERGLNKVFPVPASSLSLVVPTDAASIDRGRHLFQTVSACALCHSTDGGGKLYEDAGPIGVIAGPNLTRGRGGVAATLTDADWDRAIRHGVKPDGRSMLVMPSEVFANLSDEDTGALIAYLKQLPAVDREVPPSRLRWFGRVLFVAGRMKIQVAPKTTDTHRVPMGREATAGQGRYLANVSGCHGCHGYGLSGGKVAGPPNLPPASNLTPAGLTGYEEPDFVRAMRTGQRPDGSRLNDFMPWRSFQQMTDGELHALWLYLRSVPPRASGNK
jgi:cytochrome c553